MMRSDFSSEFYARPHLIWSSKQIRMFTCTVFIPIRLSVWIPLIYAQFFHCYSTMYVCSLHVCLQVCQTLSEPSSGLDSNYSTCSATYYSHECWGGRTWAQTLHREEWRRWCGRSQSETDGHTGETWHPPALLIYSSLLQIQASEAI